MTDHAVTLPYPDRQERTVGSCMCGWLVAYTWGEHGEGQAKAEDHIRSEAHAEPYVLTEMSGRRFVRAGASL